MTALAIAGVVSATIGAVGTILSAYVAAKARDTNSRLREFHERWSSNGD